MTRKVRTEFFLWSLWITSMFGVCVDCDHAYTSLLCSFCFNCAVGLTNSVSRSLPVTAEVRIKPWNTLSSTFHPSPDETQSLPTQKSRLMIPSPFKMQYISEPRSYLFLHRYVTKLCFAHNMVCTWPCFKFQFFSFQMQCC